MMFRWPWSKRPKPGDFVARYDDPTHCVWPDCWSEEQLIRLDRDLEFEFSGDEGPKHVFDVKLCRSHCDRCVWPHPPCGKGN